MSKHHKNPKRWTAKRKFRAVLELIKNHKTLDELSRETGQPAHILSQWRDDFLNQGESLFKAADTPKEKEQEDQVTRLKTKIGEITMDNDLLYEKIRRLENGVPFHLRKSKL